MPQNSVHNFEWICMDFENSCKRIQKKYAASPPTESHSESSHDIGGISSPSPLRNLDDELGQVADAADENQVVDAADEDAAADEDVEV